MATVRDATWDEETDVVVLGCGGAGAVAAISACDAGARVIVVEKGEPGGNTRLATMAFVCPTNNSSAREHIKTLSFGTLDEEMIDIYVEWTSKNVDYIKQLGGEVERCYPGASFPTLPGSETMLRYRVKDGQAVIWSVGEDGRDDDGVLSSPSGHKSTVPGEDIVFVEPIS